MANVSGTTNVDTLARSYLAILAAEEEASSRAAPRGDPDDPIDLMLDETPSDASGIGSAVRADYAAAAVLVARTVGSVAGLIRMLRRQSPIATFTVASKELVDLAGHVLEKCAFGTDASVMVPSEFFVGRKTRPVLLVARDGTGKLDRPDEGNTVVARAIHAQAPIVGIATDPRRHLPRDLVRASEYELVVPPLDPSAISLVVEAVAGKPPTVEIDEALVGACDLSDLALSIRPDLSPDACIERLRTIVRRKYLRDALPQADLMAAALAAAGGTGADVESWTRRAHAKARRERREMGMDDLLDVIRDGRRPMPKRLCRAVALHESGHLVVGIALKVFAPHSVSIADEGGTARAEVRIEDIQTLPDIERIIVTLLAGRAAEEEFLTSEGSTAGWAGDPDSDLAKATRAAAAIELKLGLGTMGPIYFSDQAAEIMMHDKTVLGAIQARLVDCFARARRLVAANRDVVAAVAKQLEQTRYLRKSEIEDLIGNPDSLATEG